MTKLQQFLAILIPAAALTACSSPNHIDNNRGELQRAALTFNAPESASVCGKYSPPPGWVTDRVFNNTNEVYLWLEKESPASFAHFMNRRPSALHAGTSFRQFLRLQSELRINTTARGLLNEKYLHIPRGSQLFISDGTFYEDEQVVLYIRPFELYRSTRESGSLLVYNQLPSNNKADLRKERASRIDSETGAYAGFAYKTERGQLCAIDLVLWRYDTRYAEIESVKNQARSLLSAAFGNNSPLFVQLKQ